MKEVWKPLPACTDYFISSLGRVKSFRRYKKGKIIKTPASSNGYQKFALAQKSNTKYYSVHRAVMDAFDPVAAAEFLGEA